MKYPVKLRCPEKLMIRSALIFLFLLFSGVLCWLYLDPPYYLCIPVYIDDCWNDPFIQVDIGTKRYSLKLDLGAELSTLYQEDLCEIDKRRCGSYYSIGVRGNKYHRTIYEVDGVKIHDLQLPKMRIVEGSQEVAIDAVITGDPEKLIHSGSIGREIFDRKNFLLDFASSKIILCKNFKDLIRDGYDIESFIKVPFETNRAGICLRAETDIGKQIFLLDTGASCCILRPPIGKDGLPIKSFRATSNWRSQKFTFGDSELGPIDFSLFEITPLVDMIDGILGVDFLKKHAIYIDSKKSIAYIGKSFIPGFRDNNAEKQPS